MPDYLALDWEAHQLCGLEASTNRQGVAVRRAFVWTWPDDLDLEKQPEQAAEWLKTQLEEAGISTRTVLVSLPRESIVVRRLTVPNAPDEELPALVQMQAATKSATPLDQLELDFLPLAQASGEGGREVLMCTMPRKKSAKLRAILEGAGLELQSLGVSSVATAEVIAREEQNRGMDPAETSLIIARHGQRVEITILQNRQVLVTHSTQIHADNADEDSAWEDESTIVAEVQRSIMSLHAQSGRLSIDRTWLVGQEAEVSRLAQALQKRLKCEALVFQPEHSVGITSQPKPWPAPIAAFAGPAGLLLCQTEPVVGALDFLNPRKQQQRRDIDKIRKIAAIAAVAVLVVTALGYRWWKVRDLQNEITETRVQIEDLEKVVDAGKPVMDSAALVGEWDQKANKELAQLGPLYSALPGTDLIYLVEYKLSPGSRSSIGQIYAVGRAKAEDDVRELFNKLAARGMEVKPYKIQQSSDSDYPVQFTLEMELPLPTASSDRSTGPRLARRS